MLGKLGMLGFDKKIFKFFPISSCLYYWMENLARSWQESLKAPIYESPPAIS